MIDITYKCDFCEKEIDSYYYLQIVTPAVHESITWHLCIECFKKIDANRPNSK